MFTDDEEVFEEAPETEEFEMSPEEDPRQGVYDRAEAQREKEILEGKMEDVPFEVSPGVIEGGAEPPKEEEEPAEAEEPKEDAPVSAPTEPATIRLKVNGKEMDMPFEEARRILQMTTAAEAARKLQEATSRQAEPPKADKDTPQIKLPEQIRREIMEINKKLYFDGAATKEEAEALLEKQANMLFELTLSATEADKMRRQQADEQFNQMQAGMALVAEVSKVHPDYKSTMFVLDAAGKERLNEYGYKEINADFGAWLDTQPDSIKFAVLESSDPRDPIEVLNRYKAFKRGGKSLADRSKELGTKKKTIDPVKGSGRAASNTAYKPQTREEVIAEIKRGRAVP